MTKLIGNIFLYLVLCGNFVNAANISFNTEFAFWRNKTQLIPALVEGLGADSLKRFVLHSPIVYLKISIDSLGYVSSLDELSFVLKGCDNKVFEITGSKLKHIEKCMINNGTQLTFSPDVLMDLSCPSDSVEDVITTRINSFIPRYFRGNIPSYYTFKLSDADIFSNYEIFWSAQNVTKQLCNDKRMTEQVESYREQNLFNDAILLLSMIYTYGDFNVNKWLDKYKFDINLSLDDNGLVTGINCNADDKIPSNFNLQQLSNFLKNNNVRFNSENENRLVIFKFPGPLYDKYARSKDFLDRMENIEAKVWYILLHRSISQSIPSN